MVYDVALCPAGWDVESVIEAYNKTGIYFTKQTINMKKQLFHIAVLCHPTAEQLEKGVSTILAVEPKVVLAKDSKEAEISASRLIPSEYSEKLSQVEILVRPF